MEQMIYQFFLDFIANLAKFGSWLVTPLEYIHLSPLALFSFTGIVAIIGIHLAKLFIDW